LAISHEHPTVKTGPNFTNWPLLSLYFRVSADLARPLLSSLLPIGLRVQNPARANQTMQHNPVMQMNRLAKMVELEMDDESVEIPQAMFHRLTRKQNDPIRSQSRHPSHSEFVKRSFRRSAKIAVYKMTGVV
jgi:hypothetical protein